MVHTTVHLVRHGEVHNPEGILYGRLPGYQLSELGQQMAARLGTYFSDGSHDVAALVASPLTRAQQTMAPIASALGLEISTDDRVIEAANYFEGMTFGVGDGSLRHPRHWPHLINPLRPSWGEPYRDQVARMHAAVADARNLAAGREAVIVSHQLPIWIARLAFEGRRLWHDPRKRECSLASVTSIHFDGDEYTGITFHEPVADLLPGASGVAGA
ncbi:histidine phosphatase family protein [Rarobacter faecitabidus]|uniref:Broad specificity phosphatase PhoE n=1 Tax=Rarobacter faecitabidus TaxID=13243 RepID=A0A542ZUA6_RARFA|nr:histidine phosphatase family protein [Rarobacter faecitabidus]TQL63780.1 broad specificity phosphatase PhoE [Rarobacter faecitabidus]